MLILVGPSASGKSAIVKQLIEVFNMKKFITCTTRNMRVGEINGIDYYFMSTEEFMDRFEKNQFIETVFYNGNYYGTLKNEADPNKVVILEPQGLKKFTKALETVFVVYLKTDVNLLKERMKKRGDSELEINTRIENDKVLFSYEQIGDVNFTIDTSNLSTKELAELIYNKYQEFINA